ncbi:MAG: PrsW family intramembrane metalloprotease [Pseudonocardiales bacterium]
MTAQAPWPRAARPLYPIRLAPPRRRWVVVVTVVVFALAGLAILGVIALRTGPVSFVLGLTLALIPVPLLVASVLVLDRYEPEPRRLMVFSFFWGATAAALIALVLNTAGSVILHQFTSGATADLISASVGAPIVEEGAKGAVIFLLLRVRRHELDGPIDGIVYAALVALGFAMTENVLYYSAAAMQGGTPGLIGTFVLRGVFSPFLHPMFTAATGIGLGYAAITRSHAARVLAPIAGLVIAMLLHGTWNAAAEEHHLVAVYLFIMVPVFFGILAVALVERHRIKRLLARVLPMYAGAGWLIPADLQMLVSLSQRRRARRFLRSRGGRLAAIAMRDYQAAATELALLHDRGERGQLAPADFTFRQHDLLRALRAARNVFTPYLSPPLGG